MKRNRNRVYVSLLILLAVFNLIAFAAPFAKTGTFWSAYLFMFIATALQIYIFHMLFAGRGFDVFVKLIESGVVQINFTIGIFKKGDRIGQLHDHGTEFIIQEKDLEKLYSIIS